MAMEDGFLRGAGPVGPSWSLSVDHLGVHYDASAPSEIERLIGNGAALAPKEIDDAEELIALMRAARLGKYNGAADLPDSSPLISAGDYVVVADQVRGDRSITGGGCDAGVFARMLQVAVAENPSARVIARVHPNRRGFRRGHLREPAQALGAELFDAPASWMSLVARARRVYVATSTAGLEALIAGVPVTCFGLPFYAGWGLTDDRQACARRGAGPSLTTVVAAAYGRYSRYLDPLSGRPTSGLKLAQRLALMRERDRTNAGVVHVIGVPEWKRAAVAPFVGGNRTKVRHAATAEHALERRRAEPGRLVAWASRMPADLADRCERDGAELWRMEDGFLRSVGLGAAMTPALSLVLDRRGIYYDPSRPSDLEHLLETQVFTTESLARAARLRRVIVEAALSKYNVGSRDGPDPFAGAQGRPRVLVPGQVENDASVRLGAGEVRDNFGLLRAVRAARPDAFIVYKPHPDVEAGLRPGRVEGAVALSLADAVATDARMPDLLASCDELHTLTSLAGFEALLRGVAVSSYGRPFYAGWGLTADACTFERRTRRLTLDELTTGALLLYPRYADPRSGWPCTAEEAAELLIARSGEPQGAGDRLNLKVRRGLARAANRRSLRTRD